MSADERGIAAGNRVRLALDKLGREITDAVRDGEAAGYELGYKAGYAKGAERTSSPEGTVAKDDMLALLDRIQLFRQSIATYDTRYAKLGEIIADFADKLGAGGP